MKQEKFWSKLGKDFISEDDMFFSPQDFIFVFDENENEFKSEIQYNDYEDKIELDEMVDELENVLIDKGVEYNILFSSFCYLIKIKEYNN